MEEFEEDDQSNWSFIDEDEPTQLLLNMEVSSYDGVVATSDDWLDTLVFIQRLRRMK